MKNIRVLVNGAKGRMGQEVVKAVTAAADLELVDQTDLGDDLIARIKASQAQAVVDFTTAAVAFENTRKILEAGVPGRTCLSTLLMKASLLREDGHS